MKYLSVLLFSLMMQHAAAQKTEILPVGTMHYIPDSLRQNWKSLKTFLEHYRPDAICVEFRMPGDSVSLMHADGERYKAINDSLQKAWGINTAGKEARINALYSELKQTEDWKKRIELYQLLYISADFANATFQAWRAYGVIAAMPENEIEKIRKTFTVYKRIESFISSIKNNEYYNIVFPLAVKFNIDHVYPVDDRTYNARLSIAFQQGYEEMQGTTYENKWNLFWEQFNKTDAAEIQKGDALMFTNTAAWQQHADYGQTTLYEESGNKYYKDYVRYWNLRNEKVVQNILHAIEGKKYKRVAVFMGNMHIPNMKKYLNAERGIAVKAF